MTAGARIAAYVYKLENRVVELKKALEEPRIEEGDIVVIRGERRKVSKVAGQTIYFDPEPVTPKE